MADSDTDRWFQSGSDDQCELLTELRAIVLATGKDIDEAIKWQRPVYSNGGTMFCYLHRSKNHVTLGFHQGASLDDPDELLEGTGKAMRHIKVRDRSDIRKRAIKSLLKQAYSNS